MAYKVLKENSIYIDSNVFKQADLNSLIIKSRNKSSSKPGSKMEKLDSLIAVDAPVSEKLEVFGYNESWKPLKKRGYVQLLKVYEKKGSGILKAFYDTIPVAMFFLLPVFALLLKLLFYKKGRYAHHLVFSFYYFSFLFTVFSILLLANMIYSVPGWIDWLIITATWIYLIMAIKLFFGKGFFISFFKTALLSFIYLAFVIPTSFGLLVVVSLFIY